jgi:hypothetical protein
MQDITMIRDEMGYTLIHLAAYNNADKCIEVIFDHVLNGSLNGKEINDDFPNYKK